MSSLQLFWLDRVYIIKFTVVFILRFLILWISLHCSRCFSFLKESTGSSLYSSVVLYGSIIITFMALFSNDFEVYLNFKDLTTRIST